VAYHDYLEKKKANEEMRREEGWRGLEERRRENSISLSGWLKAEEKTQQRNDCNEKMQYQEE